MISCAVIALAGITKACELLITAKDWPGDVNSAAYKRGKYRAGMVIAIKPDGAVWGKAERPPRYAVIKLPGVPVSRAQKYFLPHTVTDTNAPDGIRMVGLKLWRFEIERIPLAIRRKLRQQGSITIGPSGDIRWTQVRDYLRNMKTGATETSTAP